MTTEILQNKKKQLDSKQMNKEHLVYVTKIQ